MEVITLKLKQKKKNKNKNKMSQYMLLSVMETKIYCLSTENLYFIFFSC